MDTTSTTSSTAPFPFRITDDADAQRVRGEIGRALMSLEGLLSEVIFRTFGRGLDPHDKEDLHQDLVLHLLANVFPRYDSTRGTQLSTFVYKCSHTHLLSVARKRGRTHASIDGIPEPVAPDQSCDHRVEVVAERIVANPAILTGRKRGAVRVSRSPSLDRIGSAVRKRIADIAAEEL